MAERMGSVRVGMGWLQELGWALRVQRFKGPKPKNTT